MSKQEDIRKWVEGCVRAVRNDRSPQIECLFKAAVDNILRGIAEKGGVIKVERELPHKMPAVPNNEWSAGYSCGEESMQDIMVEWHNDSLLPLIKEKK